MIAELEKDSIDRHVLELFLLSLTMVSWPGSIVSG